MTNDLDNALFHYLIRLSDNALILGQRLSEWCGKGPMLEEDIALSNLSLDYIGRARLLLAYAADVENKGRSEDDLAFLRFEHEYRNCLLMEQPNGDFAMTMARQMFASAFDLAFYRAMVSSSDSRLAAIAVKIVKEAQYHWHHTSSWVTRLGDGTPLSAAKMQAAVDALWWLTGELFEQDSIEQSLLAQGIACDLSRVKSDWLLKIDALLDEARLTRPDCDRSLSGGRQGVHTEHFGYLLCELQYMQRAYPGLRW